MFQAIVLVAMTQVPAADRAESGERTRRSMVAAQLYVFGQRSRRVGEPLDEVLATAKRAGYDNVQGYLSYYSSSESAKRLAALLAKHGLAMPVAYCGGTMHVQERADKAIDTIVRQAKLGAARGLKVVAMNPTPLKHEKTDAELDIQAMNLDRLGGALGEIGVRLAIHQHAPEMRSGAREWYHILRHTDPKKVFFCLDLDWVVRGKQDPYRLLEDAGRPKRVIDLHPRTSRNGVWFEELADGDVDYGRVTKILEGIRYQGTYTVELAHERKTEVTRSLEQNLKRSREYVRRVLGK